MDINSFHFQPLSNPGHTRLVYIEPASSIGDDLRATMTEVSLAQEDPVYEAVSYAWGDRTLVDVLHFGNALLPISKNVSELLRYFRLTTEPRCLWLDSVCIDQKNDQEKGPQVYMMDAVYQRAKAVLIWLGPEDTLTSTAMAFVSKIASAYGKEVKGYSLRSKWLPPPCLKETSDLSQETLQMIVDTASSDGLDSLCRRDWFTRLWIVQEVALAKYPLVHCGSICVNWSVLIQAVRLVIAAARRLGHALAQSLALNTAVEIDDIREHFRWASNRDLLLGPIADYDLWGDIVVKMSGQKCTLDHDRVYGMIGLRPRFLDSMRPGMRHITDIPDYTKEINELFREFTLDMFIGSNQNILLYAGLWRRQVHRISRKRVYLSHTESGCKGGAWVSLRDFASMYTQQDFEPDDEALSWQLNAEEPASCGFRLTLTSAIPKLETLPSWVPNIAHASSEYPAYELPWVKDDQAFHAGGLLRMGGALMLRQGEEMSAGTSRIYLKGSVVDTISMTCMLPHMSHVELGHSSRPLFIYNLVTICRQLVESIAEEGSLPYGEDVVTALARVLVTDGCGSTMQSLFPFENFRESNAKDNSNDVESERNIAKIEKLKSYFEVYTRFWESIDFDANSFPLDVSFAELFPPEMPEVERNTVEAYHRCLEETLEGHIFFQTKSKGYVGLAPLLIAPNDSIIVLPSVRLPLVVRAGEVDDAQKLGEKLSGNVLLGPCFAHGLMYGENGTEHESAIPVI